MFIVCSYCAFSFISASKMRLVHYLLCHSKLQSASERSNYNHINVRTPWTTASPQDLTLALYESASASRWSPHPLTTRAQHQTASSPPPPSTMSPPSSSSWFSHLRAISQVVCSHIVWNKKKGGPARCVLPDYCSSDRRNIGPLLPRLLPVTCSNTASAVIQLRDNCKTTVIQL